MTHIAFVHSYRGGTGKSTMTANLAALLAAAGKKVGVVDTNLQAPGLHYLFGLSELDPTLNDYLRGKCEIQAAAHQVIPERQQPRFQHKTAGKPTANATPASLAQGAVYLIPASDRTNQIVHAWAKGFDMEFLISGLEELNSKLALDFLLIDTDPGMDRQTFFALELADSFIMVLSPDEQDYRGAAATVRIAHLLEIPNIYVLLNKVPAELDMTQLCLEIEALCESPISAQVPHAVELLMRTSKDLFVRQYPDHPITQELKRVADELAKGTKGMVRINQQMLNQLLA